MGSTVLRKPLNTMLSDKHSSRLPQYPRQEESNRHFVIEYV
jgi:hypothetical protein